MNPHDIRRVAHTGTVLAAHIMAPNPDLEAHQRNQQLASIATDGNPAALMIASIAHCAQTLAKHHPDRNLDDAINKMHALPSGSVGYEIGIGFARRALATDTADPSDGIDFLSHAIIDLGNDDTPTMERLIGEAMGVALAVLQAHSSPW